VQQSGGFDLGGFKLGYGPSNNRGSSEVFLTKIEADGSVKPVTSLAKGKF
jgi:branched-chain amino acid transport system substrate-binding protein